MVLFRLVSRGFRRKAGLLYPEKKINLIYRQMKNVSLFVTNSYSLLYLINFYERNCTQEEQIIDFELTREMKDNEKLSFKILLQFLCEKDYAIISLKIVPV